MGRNPNKPLHFDNLKTKASAKAVQLLLRMGGRQYSGLGMYRYLGVGFRGLRGV